MRRIAATAFIAWFVAVACPLTAHGQSRIATPHYPWGEMRDSLLKGVALTDSQKIKVETIARGYLDLMHANDARMRGAPRDSQRVFVRELQGKQVNDLRRILTPAQQKQFDQNRMGPKTTSGPK